MARADKVLVLGIDGMDPRYSKKLLSEGKMPNLQKFVEKGAQREDLAMMGGILRLHHQCGLVYQQVLIQ